MAVRYEERLIQTYADRLYSMAIVVVTLWTLLGAGAGYIAGQLLLRGNAGGETALVAGMIGFAIGQGKAFWYRLEAQVALCQVQIERNTRPNDGQPLTEAVPIDEWLRAEREEDASALGQPAVPVDQDRAQDVAESRTHRRFCGECGTPILANTDFCPQCRHLTVTSA